MSTAQMAWVISLVVAGGLLPVGAVRMLIYRSGDVDHTPALRFVAWFALVLGACAFVIWAVLTGWFLVTGSSPV